ncbi:MAG TPA: hypothetical protein VGN00_29550 [Puia sp.]|jgi:hypothetical protein
MKRQIVKRSLFLLFLFFSFSTFAQDADSIRILIIYGSKPAKGHPAEYKWFGGRPGGHVAIQVDNDRVISFGATKYRPMCHIFARSRPARFKSRYRIESVERFWGTFNYTGARYIVDSLRRMVVSIPVSPIQKRRLDSIVSAYTAQVPYDYAVLGMRCASSSYEILAQLDLLEKPYKRHFWWHILFPRDIRYELMKEVKQGRAAGTWRVYQQEGSRSRKWDYDRKV